MYICMKTDLMQRWAPNLVNNVDQDLQVFFFQKDHICFNFQHGSWERPPQMPPRIFPSGNIYRTSDRFHLGQMDTIETCSGQINTQKVICGQTVWRQLNGVQSRERSCRHRLGLRGLWEKSEGDRESLRKASISGELQKVRFVEFSTCGSYMN